MPSALKACCALLVCLGLLASCVSEQSPDVADRFLAAVKQDDNAAAYAMTAKAFQQTARPEQLEIFVRSYRLAEIAETHWESERFEGGNGTLQGKATLEDGSEIDLTIELIQEEEQWKILQLTSSSEPASKSEGPG